MWVCYLSEKKEKRDREKGTWKERTREKINAIEKTKAK